MQDGTKCFPVAICLKCRDWVNCLEFRTFSVENEGRVLLSSSIFQLTFLRHFTDALFLNVRMSCNSIHCIQLYRKVGLLHRETQKRGEIKMTVFKLTTEGLCL